MSWSLTPASGSSPRYGNRCNSLNTLLSRSLMTPRVGPSPSRNGRMPFGWMSSWRESRIRSFIRMTSLRLCRGSGQSKTWLPNCWDWAGLRSLHNAWTCCGFTRFSDCSKTLRNACRVLQKPKIGIWNFVLLLWQKMKVCRCCLWFHTCMLEGNYRGSKSPIEGYHS